MKKTDKCYVIYAKVAERYSQHLPVVERNLTQEQAIDIARANPGAIAYDGGLRLYPPP